MRPIVCFALMILGPGRSAWAGSASAGADAQESAGVAAADSSADGYRALVRGRSPGFTQDRNFGGSRMWLLDPGRYEAEIWFRDKLRGGGRSQGMLQAEIEIGLAPRLQLDIYQNLRFDEGGNWASEGQQIELRYAFAGRYDELWLNPVLYLEWHPKHLAANRAEVRLLLGGDARAGLLVWAANVYIESNVDGFAGRGYWQAANAEAGLTGAASVGLLGQHLRLGAEARIGAHQHGNGGGQSTRFYPVLLLGPNVLLRWQEQGLKLTATLFFGLMPKDPRLTPTLIAGWLF